MNGLMIDCRFRDLRYFVPECFYAKSSAMVDRFIHRLLEDYIAAYGENFEVPFCPTIIAGEFIAKTEDK